MRDLFVDDCGWGVGYFKSILYVLVKTYFAAKIYDAHPPAPVRDIVSLRLFRRERLVPAGGCQVVVWGGSTRGWERERVSEGRERERSSAATDAIQHLIVPLPGLRSYITPINLFAPKNHFLPFSCARSCRRAAAGFITLQQLLLNWRSASRRIENAVGTDHIFVALRAMLSISLVNFLTCLNLFSSQRTEENLKTVSLVTVPIFNTICYDYMINFTIPLLRSFVLDSRNVTFRPIYLEQCKETISSIPSNYITDLYSK